LAQRAPRLEALYGGFTGEPLDDDSREYVFVGRRESAPTPVAATASAAASSRT
jgi:hypothetical protein